MARRTTIKRKPKTIRKTKSETYLVNLKYLGDEPSYKGKMSNSDYMRALTWYNSMCTTAEAREYLETYLNNQARTKELKLLKSVPDVWINSTSAWVARMINRGLDIPETSRTFLENKLKDSFTHVNKKVEQKETNNTEKVSIQDRIKEKTSDIIGLVEGLIDDRETLGDFSFYEWLQKEQIPALYGPKIIEKYIPLLQELIEAIEGKDQQLKEAYKIYNKKQMNAYMSFVNMIIEDCERYTSNTKKVRKPRKPRTISVEKKLKNFKYQKEDLNYKIASVQPEKVIGCQELWLFNTKYKTLTVLRAMNREGIQVKGTSFINYDEQNSFTKRTGRKPEYYVDRVLNGGKIVLRKLMDELKNEISLAYRCNESTILLRAIQ